MVPTDKQVGLGWKEMGGKGRDIGLGFLNIMMDTV